MSAVPLQPYLGLRTYQEEHSAIFCGRERESMELVRLVEADTASILYGVSGVGKSSLLRAGLFPRLRALDYLPVVVRLDHEETAPPPTLQVLTRLHEAALAEGVVDHPPPGERETLWEYFHHPDRTEYWTSDHRLLTPVLALDQFEEFFSLGEENAARRLRGTAFRAELISLLANRPPAGLDASIAWQRSPVAWKLILALREDFVAQLLPIVDELAEVLPSIHRQKLRLLPFDAAAVTEVVEKPWAAVGLPAPEVGAAEALAERWHVSERGIAPAQLSMLLTGAQSRLAEGQRLPVAWFADSSPEQISAHLDSVLAKEPPEARQGLEDHFISGKGFRLRVHAADAPLPEQSLKRLMQEGILNFQRGNPGSYELSHDLLGVILRESRNRRREQEKAEELTSAERTRMLDFSRRRAIWVATFAAFVALMAIAACSFALVQRQKAERQRINAEIARLSAARSEREAREAQANAIVSRQAAEELINYMQHDLRNKLSNLGQLSLLDAINSRIIKYYEDHPPEEGDFTALRERSISLKQQGDILLAKGDLAAASSAFRAGYEIAERLSDSNPRDAEWQRDWSNSYDNLGDAKLAQGRGAGALQEYKTSQEIRERLAKSDPTNQLWQQDWSESCRKIGDLKLAQGDSAGAFQDYQVSLEICKRLAIGDPGNTKWQRDLSLSYDKIGDVKLTQGDSEGALQDYQASRDIRERLAKSGRDNTESQRDLSVSYDKIGDVKHAQDNSIGALQDYQASLKIREHLAKGDPLNTELQRLLSVSYDKMGIVNKARGERLGALQAYQVSLDFRKRLTNIDPDNLTWQRDLSLSYENIGYLNLAYGENLSALWSYQAGLEIIERLANSDPHNADWQQGLSHCLFGLAKALEGLGNVSSALLHYERSLSIDERLSALDPNNAVWKRDLDISHITVMRVKALLEKAK